MKECVGVGELRDKVQYTHECFTMVGGTEGRGGNEVGWRDGKAASGVWRQVVRVCPEGTVGYSSRCSIPHTVHSIQFPAHTAPGVARWSAFPVVQYICTMAPLAAVSMQYCTGGLAMVCWCLETPGGLVPLRWSFLPGEVRDAAVVVIVVLGWVAPGCLKLRRLVLWCFVGCCVVWCGVMWCVVVWCGLVVWLRCCVIQYCDVLCGVVFSCVVLCCLSLFVRHRMAVRSAVLH